LPTGLCRSWHPEVTRCSTKAARNASFTESLDRQREDTFRLVEQRQVAHTQRFGEPMTGDNIWLRGRQEELAALDSIRLAIQGIRREDGEIVPLRGAGAPQQRLDPPDSEVAQ
jgi:hypothetical protein